MEKAKITEATDIVTGFYIDVTLCPILEKRYSQELSFMMITITNFKEIEHNNGRHVSEHVLKEIAFRLGKTFRKSDIVSKYSEDKFAIILPSTSLEKCEQVKERVIDIIHSSPVFHMKEIKIEAKFSTDELEKSNEENEDTILNRLDK